MDNTALAKELLDALIRKDNYRNIINATDKLSDSALLCRYLQQAGSAAIKEIKESTDLQYDKIYDTVRILIDKNVVEYNGFLSLNENTVISLTEKGTEELKRFSADAVSFVSRQLDKLSPEEAEQYVKYSLKIINTDTKTK